MSSTPSPRVPAVTGGRALVLGGGGSAGNAWLIGVVAGLRDGGVDVTHADLVIGTSAGATAAAQLASAVPADLVAAVLAEAPHGRPGDAGASVGGSAARSAGPGLLLRTGEVIAASGDLADMRRRMGAAALAADPDPADAVARAARWRATVAARLPSPDWPGRRLLVTAVDARTGEPVVLDSRSGPDLVDAVAASCANGFAHVVGDRRLIDGGYRRSSENADLAAGYARVLVLSPLGGRTRWPAAWGGHDLAAQVAELRAGGSRVETVLPDAASREAFGDNLMDPSTRPRAARAGREQGRRLAGPLASFWS